MHTPLLNLNPVHEARQQNRRVTLLTSTGHEYVVAKLDVWDDNANYVSFTTVAHPGGATPGEPIKFKEVCLLRAVVVGYTVSVS